MRSRSGTVRRIASRHDRDKLRSADGLPLRLMRFRVDDRLEGAIAERLGRLPRASSAACPGRPPIVIDGQRLEADVQLMLALGALLGEPMLGRAPDRGAGVACSRVRRRPPRRPRKVPVAGGGGAARSPGLPARRLRQRRAGREADAAVPARRWLRGRRPRHARRAVPRPLPPRGRRRARVEYRKAPEHPFPAYVEDARRATSGRPSATSGSRSAATARAGTSPRPSRSSTTPSSRC